MQFSMQTVLRVVFVAVIAVNTGLTCPTGYGCYRDPSGCGDTGAAICDLLVAWKANDADGIDFIARAKNSGTNPRWHAIGFSLDSDMGDDDILMCRQTNSSTVVLEHYWSYDDPLRIEDKTQDPPSLDGLSNVVTEFQDGVVTCNFTRAVSVADQSYIYDLSETTTADMTPKYYFVFGQGPVVGNVPQEHEENPSHSSSGVNYTVASELIIGEGSSSEEDDAAGHIIGSMLLLLMMTSLAIFFKKIN